VKGTSKHDRDFVLVAEQNAFAVVEDHVVHRREVMIANKEFSAAVCRQNWKVVNSVFVLHRYRILAHL